MLNVKKKHLFNDAIKNLSNNKKFHRYFLDPTKYCYGGASSNIFMVFFLWGKLWPTKRSFVCAEPSVKPILFICLTVI